MHVQGNRICCTFSLREAMIIQD